MEYYGGDPVDPTVSPGGEVVGLHMLATWCRRWPTSSGAPRVCSLPLVPGAGVRQAGDGCLVWSGGKAAPDGTSQPHPPPHSLTENAAPEKGGEHSAKSPITNHKPKLRAGQNKVGSTQPLLKGPCVL